ncbi:hypothetical protein D9M68_990540 [compost metagenome]
MQWTRSRDGLGGVLRKVLSQRREGVVPQRAGSAVQHMLLVANGGGGRKDEHWLDSHPPLAQRIRRIYGRDMGPLPLLREDDAPPASAPVPVATVATGEGGPGWTLR